MEYFQNTVSKAVIAVAASEVTQEGDLMRFQHDGQPLEVSIVDEGGWVYATPQIENDLMDAATELYSEEVLLPIDISPLVAEAVKAAAPDFLDRQSTVDEIAQALGVEYDF